MQSFDFPLGCYPVEPVEPIEGFTLHFEPADGGQGEHEGDDEPETIAEFGAGDGPDIDGDEDDAPRGGGGSGSRAGGVGGGRGGREGTGGMGPDGMGRDNPREGGGGEGEWEEWPDRYVFDVLIRAARIDPFLRTLFSLLPGRVFPILDVLGNDAYREIDPYVAYEMVGTEQFLDAVRRFRGYLMEDGFVGFGVMSEEPFYYLFVDEHKMVTIRAEASVKERVERVLQAYDLKPLEQLTGSDSAVHEHRGVLEAPPDRPDLLTAEEIIEELRDVWGLELNVDPHRNLDDRGRELGITGWRCVVRRIGPDGMVRYLEVCLSAGSLMEAHDLALFAAEHEAGEAEEDDESGKEAPGKPGKGARNPRNKPLLPPGGSTIRSGRRTNEPSEDDSQDADSLLESESEALTTVDVVVMDRLASEQLEELAKELGLKNATATTKKARVWAWRWAE